MLQALAASPANDPEAKDGPSDSGGRRGSGGGRQDKVRLARREAYRTPPAWATALGRQTGYLSSPRALRSGSREDSPETEPHGRAT